jgi:hypothetical protein
MMRITQHIGNLRIKVETIKKKQIEILEWKWTMTKINHLVNRLKKISEMSEEKTQWIYRLVHENYPIWRKMNSISVTCKALPVCQICVRGIIEGEEKGKEYKHYA